MGFFDTSQNSAYCSDLLQGYSHLSLIMKFKSSIKWNIPDVFGDKIWEMTIYGIYLIYLCMYVAKTSIHMSISVYYVNSVM